MFCFISGFASERRQKRVELVTISWCIKLSSTFWTAVARLPSVAFRLKGCSKSLFAGHRKLLLWHYLRSIPCIYKCHLLVWFSELFPEAGVRHAFLLTAFSISNLQASACLHGTRLASNLNCTLLQLQQRSSCYSRCLCGSCGLMLHCVGNVCIGASSGDPAYQCQGFVSFFPPNYVNYCCFAEDLVQEGALEHLQPYRQPGCIWGFKMFLCYQGNWTCCTLTRLLPPSLALRGFCLAWNNLAVLSWLWRGSQMLLSVGPGDTTRLSYFSFTRVHLIDGSCQKDFSLQKVTEKCKLQNIFL